MLVRREKYDIFAWLIVLAMCVSYLGIYGLYNPNVKNYSAHSVASLGESRGIEAGNNDMLMVDNTAGLTVQTRNIKTGNMVESLEDTWMLAAVLAAVLLSLIVCPCIIRSVILNSGIRFLPDFHDRLHYLAFFLYQF